MPPPVPPLVIPPTPMEGGPRGQDLVSPLPLEPVVTNGSRRPAPFRVKRKPVPGRSRPPTARSASYRPDTLRPESHRPESRRPESSRSFSAGFAWIGEAILWPTRKPSNRAPKRELPDMRENTLPRRFTSVYDPRMSSGMTLYDPSVDANRINYTEDKLDSTLHKNLAMLDMTWNLPNFKWAQYAESQTRTSIDVVLAEEDNTSW